MELNIEKWTAEDYKNFQQLIRENAEEEYKNFHSRLCKTSKAEILGVRLPILKKFAKEIAKGNVESFVKHCKNACYEETMTEGLAIALYKKTIEEKIGLIEGFIPKIDNWAICDSFCSALKPKKSELQYLFDFCMKYVYSDKEYEIRFATVTMMDNMILPEYIDRLYEIFDKTNCSFYYTSMVVAWSISFCFVKFREKTMKYLEHNELDKDTFNRALQKIVDSHRVSDEDKAIIKSMRKK